MKRKIKNCVVSLLAVTFAFSISAIADTPTTSNAASRPEQKIQEEVFQYLNGKSGSEINAPNYPQNGLIAWSLKRYREAPEDAKLLYKLIGEDLHIAQDLLNDKSVQRQRQGMRLTQYTGNFVFSKLTDKWLYARVYEGFLLPYLAAAHKDHWQDLSRQRIVESAASAFGQVGEKDKQIVALQSLLKMETNQNTTDWTHSQLAQVRASQENYAEAISQLQAIESPSMSSIKKLIPQYEKKLQEQKDKQGKTAVAVTGGK